MRSVGRCPGCGTPEGVYHEAYCKVAPIGITPCCGARIYDIATTEHEPTCPAGWGSGGLSVPDYIYPTFAVADPWRHP